MNYFQILLKSLKDNVNDEVPVASCIVYRDSIISIHKNCKKRTNNLLYHSEILCIIDAINYFDDWRLNECSLYCTLKPCHMCQEVIKESRIKNVYYLADNLKNINYKTNFIKISDENEKKYCALLKDFFKKLR